VELKDYVSHGKEPKSKFQNNVKVDGCVKKRAIHVSQILNQEFLSIL
jgi:hypothetical protein